MSPEKCVYQCCKRERKAENSFRLKDKKGQLETSDYDQCIIHNVIVSVYNFQSYGYVRERLFLRKCSDNPTAGPDFKLENEVPSV